MVVVGSGLGGQVVGLGWGRSLAVGGIGGVWLVELRWCMKVAVSSDGERDWLAMVSWIAFGSVGVTQLKHGGDVGAGAVGIRSQGALI